GIGVANNPVQGTTAVLDGRRGRRILGQPVLHVDDREAHLEVREDDEIMLLLVLPHPSAAVDEHQYRGRSRRVARAVDIQPQIRVVLGSINDVGLDDIVQHQVTRPEMLSRILSTKARGEEGNTGNNGRFRGRAKSSSHNRSILGLILACWGYRQY